VPYSAVSVLQVDVSLEPILKPFYWMCFRTFTRFLFPLPRVKNTAFYSNVSRIRNSDMRVTLDFTAIWVSKKQYDRHRYQDRQNSPPHFHSQPNCFAKTNHFPPVETLSKVCQGNFLIVQWDFANIRTTLLFSGQLGVSLQVKELGHKADYSPPSNAEVMNVFS